MTALKRATIRDYTDMLELLLKFGARVDLEDQYGRTARMYATSEAARRLLDPSGSPPPITPVPKRPVYELPASPGSASNIRQYKEQPVF